jgi:hypothetical protein
MTQDWTSQKIRKCLEALKNLPDFEKYPLPEDVYKEFNIPMKDSISASLSDYLMSHRKTRATGELYPLEHRENDGIMRPILDISGVETSILTKEDLEALNVPSPAAYSDLSGSALVVLRTPN